VIAEPFALGDTFLHRADARVKFASAVLLSCVLAVSPSTGAPALALPLAAGMTLLSRPPWRCLARRLLTVNAFTAFLWLFLPFCTPGEAVFRLGSFTATAPGVAAAWLVTLKTNAIMLFFLSLVATSDAAALGQAMHRLRVPAKLVFLFLFTYRFINVIGDEQRRLMTAARLRGFRPGTNPHTYRTLASLLAMVLLGAMRRAEMVRRSMVLRGFTGTFATLRVFRLAGADILLLAGLSSAAAMFALLEVLHV
jgi:cobalt/nickel transport system permease protein